MHALSAKIDGVQFTQFLFVKQCAVWISSLGSVAFSEYGAPYFLTRQRKLTL